MTSPAPIQLDQLDACIRSAWARGQMLHVVAGLLAALRWAIPLWLLAVLVDWMTYMPATGRGVLLVIVLGVSLIQAWRCGWRRLRPFNPVHTALKLESHDGELRSLLVSAIQLRSAVPAGGASVALRDQTCQLAEKAAADLHPAEAVPYRTLRQPGSIAAAMFAVIAVFAVIDGPFLAAGLTRIFAPWTAIEYPTDTQITLDQRDLVIKQGANATISARIAGEVPAQATILVHTGQGAARAIALDITDSSCAYTIDSASRDFTYRLKAGDDRTPWHTVRVVPTPRIEQVTVEQRFPDYLERANETIAALTLSVPEGTNVSWQVTLDRPIREAWCLRDGQPPSELHVSEDGRTVRLAEDVAASRGYSFTWVDREHGFEFTSPRYYLQVVADQAPRVELTSPASNLVAMVGRPMQLAVRAQDDHGIDTTAVAYRINQREQVVAALETPVRAGQGAQPIDWDYWQALPDLAIGDTLTFAVAVSDRYPKPLGPHTARSEARRITFVSKQQYLQQIARQRNRLLSRVQTIYRQQRTSHELALTLDPSDAGYMQACQLEAIRQGMVREQLKQIAQQLRSLLDDLQANGVAEAAEADSIAFVRAALIDIADSHVAEAGVRLRDQSGSALQQRHAFDTNLAAHAINESARALGGLVLLRGIDAAQEVYAREASMLAQLQVLLRWATITSGSTESAAGLSRLQTDLARWTDELIADLQAGMQYDRRPLAVLRLIRSVKDLQSARTAERMREAAASIQPGRFSQAADVQADLVTDLLDAQFSVRLTGAYSAVLETRGSLQALALAQQQLQRDIADLSSSEQPARQARLTEAQADLRKQLLTLMLPTVPAPRAELFDDAPRQVPPVRELLAQVDGAMADALSELAANRYDQAQVHQALAQDRLTKLAGIIDRWSVELGMQTQGLGTLVATSSQRLSRIEEFEARVIGLLDKTDIAAADDKNVSDLADLQQILGDELALFCRDLISRNQSEPNRDLPPLISRLQLAQQAIAAATVALQANTAGNAIEQQERAADALAQAYQTALAQHERLTKLQDLLMFQRAVGFANGYMADIVAQQRDLLAATRASEPDAMSRMLPKFGNMQNCLVDVAPLLDLVAARLDVGTPLAFAKADFEDAMASIQIGDKFDAVDAQDVAAESLASVQARVHAVQTQTVYVAEIVEYLHGAASDAAMLRHRQTQLLARAGDDKLDDPQMLVAAQQALLTDAQAFGRQLQAVTGKSQYTAASEHMQQALDQLKANDIPAGVEQMTQAASALETDAQAVLAAISVLHGLPSIAITMQSEPQLVRLIDVLALASDHKQLLRQTHDADAQQTDALAKRQARLAKQCRTLAATGEPNALLDAARDLLSSAASAFEGERHVLRRSQKQADAKLRHFIIEQALILDTSIPPPVPSDDPGDSSEGSDSESAFSAGFISDFVSGELPDDKRTEWKVLADRNRAAINQNFARELPLEYRGLLKNYYERVAK